MNYKYKKSMYMIVLVMIMVFIVGCTPKSEEFSINDLAYSMEERNYEFEIINAEDDFLSGDKKILKIDKEQIDIYVYKNNKAMEKDASCIGNVSEYNNGKESVKVDWVATPHFFKHGNIIVIYVGENIEIISSLTEIFGREFTNDNHEDIKAKENS
ncbi:hypothetical protein [Clostridium sardiniense]|uniref:hypothetical protein n=1 Tax=Clostridium sardiniense TaxID=29369 RepID=UPI003D3585CE